MSEQIFGLPEDKIPGYLDKLTAGFSGAVSKSIELTGAADWAVEATDRHQREDLYGLITQTFRERPFCVQEVEPIQQLTAAQSALIRDRVRVLAVFAPHGTPALPDFQEASWAKEENFTICRQILEKIDPDQGDVLAIERPGHEELNGRGLVSCSTGAAEQAANLLELEELCRNRSVDPFIYTETLAAAQSVPVFLTDASERELREWEASKNINISNQPRVRRSPLTPRDHFRDERAAAKAAAVAFQMAQSGYYPQARRKPVLYILYNSTHLRTLVTAMHRVGMSPDDVIERKYSKDPTPRSR